MRRRTKGVAAPPATGTSGRPAISTRRKALGRVKERGTFPLTAVTASIFSSGERSARKRAMASSTPGSQSRRIGRGEAAAAGKGKEGSVLAAKAPAEAPRNDLLDMRGKWKNIMLLSRSVGSHRNCHVRSEILQQTRDY